MNSRVTSFKVRELFPLGEGGMGVTYLGCAKGAGGFERLIAIKRLHEHLQQDEEARTRLLFEAELAGCVQHANVVGVQHVDQDERGAFLVLDYVDGGSLSQLLKACRPKPLPQQIVLRVVLDCLAGLEAIHTATNYRGAPLQILHRDISPDNVLIGLDGMARLTDFGIARANHHPSLTGPTQLVGKLTFMAPEYIDKRDIGPPLDVYSLGVMMWILLTGKSPWKGLEEAQMLARLLIDGVPPLPDHIPVDDAVRAIVKKACAKNLSERYGSALSMASALEGLAATHPIATHSDVALFVQEKFNPSTSERRLKAAQLLKVESIPPLTFEVGPAETDRKSSPQPSALPSSDQLVTASYKRLESATESYSSTAFQSLVRISTSGVDTVRSGPSPEATLVPSSREDSPTSLDEPTKASKARRSGPKATWKYLLWVALAGSASALVAILPFTLETANGPIPVAPPELSPAAPPLLAAQAAPTNERVDALMVASEAPESTQSMRKIHPALTAAPSIAPPTDNTRPPASTGTRQGEVAFGETTGADATVDEARAAEAPVSVEKEPSAAAPSAHPSDAQKEEVPTARPRRPEKPEELPGIVLRNPYRR